MSRLTDTQRAILSVASRRNDRGVDLPANVTGEALRKAVDKLIRAGLLEEVRAHGSLLGWRRDAEAGPMALRITQQGLEAVGVTEDTVETSTETPIGAAARCQGLSYRPPPHCPFGVPTLTSPRSLSVMARVVIDPAVPN